MINLVLSEKTRDTKYYRAHYYFFIEYALMAGVKITYAPESSVIYAGNPANSIDAPFFSCLINDRQVIIDFSDFSTWDFSRPGARYLKFQTAAPLREHVIPLGPPIVGNVFRIRADMKDYMDLRNSFRYSPIKTITNKQAPYGNAVNRRLLVKQLLQENFQNIDISNGKGWQIDFWKAHEDALLAVCVPGATNNMIDRGQMELIGLGVCTVSPRLETVLPWYQTLQPGMHYLMCNDDYSDLVEVITWAEKNPVACQVIGDNAKRFFDQYYTPKKYWEWILENVND